MSIFILHINCHDYLLLCYETCIPRLCARADLDNIENTISNVRMYLKCGEEREIMYIPKLDMDILVLFKHECLRHGWKQTKQN